MKNLRFIAFFIIFLGLAASCTSIHKTMKEPNSHVEFYKDDFTYSEQVTAEATQTLIFGIDFARLFKSETASVSSNNILLPLLSYIPVVGSTSVLSPKSTESLALYNLMIANPGYDVVFYPQYETKEDKPIGLRIFRIKTVKVTARLGKLK
jgi:hypothetical protein